MDTQHFFILNPQAGVKSAREKLEAELKKLDSLPYTLFITSSPGDAARFVRDTCQTDQRPLRFYACGGDGTLADVAQGAYPFKNAAIACWPCGSGNDYARYYGGSERFLDLGRQIAAPTVLVDLIDVNGRVCVNVANIGLEAEAAKTMLRLRHHPVVGGKRAYIMGVLSAVTKHMKTNCSVSAEGEALYAGELLTLSLASGRFVGGGFQCAPRAKNDDGILELCIIRPMSRVTLFNFIGIYKQGRHLDHPKIKPYLLTRRISQAEVSSDRELTLCLDGEIVKGRSFAFRVLPRAVRFILPEMG